MEYSFAPPSHPPPLLSDGQVVSLAEQGWLNISLPRHLERSLAALSQASTTFFAEDNSTKLRLYPTRSGTESGFYPVENEKEYVTFRSTQHPESQLELLVAQVWRDAAAFLQRILCDIARGLDLPSEVWDSLLDGCLELPPAISETNPSLLRLFQYYPGCGFAAEHTDLGLLTLCVGRERGLQARLQESEEQVWIDADGPLILTGNVLRVLSGGRVRAGAHRVVENSNGRNSIVFALRPSLRHPIQLSCFGMEGTVHSLELYDAIKSTKVNINANKDIRDQQSREILARKKNLECNAAS